MRRIRHAAPCAALLLLLATAAPGLAAGTPLWMFQGIEDINAMALLPDVDGDAVPDVLVETYDAGAVGDHLYLLSGGSVSAPAVIWSARPESGASNGGGYGDYCLATCPDLSGDGFPDVLLATAWGNRSVHALDGITGDVLWTFDSYTEPESGWIYGAAWHPDRTGDGLPEVIFGTGSELNRGFMVSGADGSVVWRFLGSTDAINLTLSLPDVDGDRYGDVLFLGGDNEHRVFCVNGKSGSSGQQIWAVDTGASNHAATLVDDLDGDLVQDIVVGNWAASNQVRGLSGATGQVLWTFDNGSYQYVMRLVTVSDMNGNGYRDVAVGSWDRALRVVDGLNGDLIWEAWAGTLNGGDFWAVDRVDDITGDGKDEIVGGSFDYNVYLFDGAKGDTLWMFNTNRRLYSVRGAPDLSGNGVADVLAGTQFLTWGGQAYALEGGLDLTPVPPALQVAGRAVLAAAPRRVELSWTSTLAVPFNVYRDAGPTGRAADRSALALAFAEGALASREVIAAITAEAALPPSPLNGAPLAAAGADGDLWRYAFSDPLAAGDDAADIRYRVAALLPGGEAVVLDLTPGQAPDGAPVLRGAAVHPNPFNPVARVTYELAAEAAVALVVHDVRGRRVGGLPAEVRPAGKGVITWTAAGADGRPLPSGVYFLTVTAAGEHRTLRAVLLK